MVLTRGVRCHLGVSVCLLLVPLHVSAVDVVGPIVAGPVLAHLLDLACFGAGVSLGAIGMFTLNPGARSSGGDIRSSRGLGGVVPVVEL